MNTNLTNLHEYSFPLPMGNVESCNRMIRVDSCSMNLTNHREYSIPLPNGNVESCNRMIRVDSCDSCSIKNVYIRV